MVANSPVISPPKISDYYGEGHQMGIAFLPFMEVKNGCSISNSNYLSNTKPFSTEP